MSALIKSEDGKLLKKVHNLTQRFSYATTHLVSLVEEANAGLNNIDRNIKEGYRIVEGFNSLKTRLQNCLDLSIALNSFSTNREQFVNTVGNELLRIQKEFKATISLKEHSIKYELGKLKEIMDEENAEHKLVKKLHEKLVHLNYGEFKRIIQYISGSDSVFPKEQEKLKKEIIHYTKKLIGAFQDLSRLLLKVERLENEEEANFGYLYNLVGDTDHKEEHKTEVQKAIHKLEQEFLG